ncbi:hypothetical protein AB0J83_03710 [Actinoplanes sp. NPDC049596]|uniref:hypothetical protein n=1 Tax=unclassified Actinoplanes TaxID=2626549 RepID=UPI0034284EF1
MSERVVSFDAEQMQRLGLDRPAELLKAAQQLLDQHASFSVFDGAPRCSIDHQLETMLSQNLSAASDVIAALTQLANGDVDGVGLLQELLSNSEDVNAELAGHDSHGETAGRRI